MKNPYRFQSTKQLIENYVFEKNRIDQNDKKRAQNLILMELDRRIEEFINMLDDEQTAENPEGTYRILIGE